MREIKFRGKDIQNGQWRYGFYFVEYKQVHENGDIDAFHYITDAIHTWEIDYKTVGQFTGIPDKNNKDIYEGDVVRFSGSKSDTAICKVEFFEGRFIFRLDDSSYRDISGWNNTEVIGNIYENKELIQ